MYDLIKSLYSDDLSAQVRYYSDSVSSRESKAEIQRLEAALRSELTPNRNNFSMS